VPQRIPTTAPARQPATKDVFNLCNTRRAENVLRTWSVSPWCHGLKQPSAASRYWLIARTRSRTSRCNSRIPSAASNSVNCSSVNGSRLTQQVKQLPTAAPLRMCSWT
jgi:hypothetical protein